MSNQPRKSCAIGDLQIKEDYDKDTKQYKPSYFEVRDKDGNVLEYLQEYQVRVYIPDDVDEAGIGEPSIVLKKDQFINARALSADEKARLPDFLKNEDGSSKVACKLRVQMNRKQYPKKPKN